MTREEAKEAYDKLQECIKDAGEQALKLKSIIDGRDTDEETIKRAEERFTELTNNLTKNITMMVSVITGVLNGYSIMI